MQPAYSDATASNPKLVQGQQVGDCFLLKREVMQARGVRVWLAQDEVLGKEVSLHFLAPTVVRDSRVMVELRQEAKRNRQLIHPNILRVYDLVEDGGMAAVVMDGFDGESMGALLKKKGPFQPKDIASWLTQLIETLADAHRLQLFHRDLAPQNLFVRPGGAILVSNFGLSRVIEDALDRAGQAKGDEARQAYMSPQQLDGERPAASDDIYGVGALIYELLTGHAPFRGENVATAIRKSTPQPLSELRAAAKLPAVSVSWERLVSACLAKTVEQRPRNCGELAAMVKVANEPAPALVKLTMEATSKAKTEPAVKSSEPPKTSIAMGSLRPQTATTPQAPPSPSAPPSLAGGTKPKIPATTTSKALPDLQRPKSNMPLIGLGIAASVLAAALYFKSGGDPTTGVGSGITRAEDAALAATGDFNANASEDAAGSDAANENGDVSSGSGAAAEEQGGDAGPSIAAGETKSETKKPRSASEAKPAPKAVPKAKPAATASEKAEASKAETPKTETPKAASGEAPKRGEGIGAIALPAAPPPPARIAIPKDATPEQLSQLLEERQNSIAKFSEAATSAEKVQVANAQLKELRAEDLDGQKKTLEEKRKTLTPVIKAATDMETERKKLEENVARTEAAAKEATRAAEAAKKAHEELMSTSDSKIAARNKAEAELTAANQAVNEGVRQVEDLTQAAAKAEAQRQQMLQAKRTLEQDVQQLTVALDKAVKAQREAMIKQNRPKITALEQQIKDVDEQLERYQKAISSLEALNDDSTKDAIQRIKEKITTANSQKAGYQEEIKKLSGADLTPKKSATPDAKPSAPENRSGAAAGPDELPPLPPLDAPGSKAQSSADPGRTNSLGMKFVTVGDVAFSVHLVTRKDFEVFSRTANLKPEHWRNPGFDQTSDHPVVNVSWKEAEAFCKWLTETERAYGRLKANEYYRLPSDTEWSKAVGLTVESGATPEERDMAIDDVYPWGKQWPPPEGAGNYAGEETAGELPIQGYNDKFPQTSPVGSFKANASGLYDMGGNVWQWVQDSYDGSPDARTLRGGSWFNGAIKMSLLSSCRIKSSSETINDTYGFRIVKASDGKK